MKPRTFVDREPLLSAGGFSSSLSTTAPVFSQSDFSQYLPVGPYNTPGRTDPAINVIQEAGTPPTLKTIIHYPSTSAVLQISTDESFYEVVIDNADPGLEWIAMMNNRNACVCKVDWSKSPLNVKVGMRLVMIDNLSVQDQPFDKIMGFYNSAIEATSEPTTLVFADDPAKNLAVSADVASALVWKQKMEAENYNSNLHNRAILFVDGLYFQSFMLLIICWDFSMMYFDSNEFDRLPMLWVQVIFWVILGIYIFEIALRIYGYTSYVYFHKVFCVFDFAVVLICTILAVLRYTKVAEALESPAFSLARLIRIVRPAMRLLTECFTKIPQAIRYKVRMNKMSYRDSKFNLDLCYITSRIISMSLPSKGLEKTFRNPIENVVNFFDAHHPSHYMVYDLCLERSYEKQLFHNRVQHFKFPDHSVPTIAMMLRFCNSVQKWMVRDPRNVIAVHCKGGKGRTGTMICAWLLYRYRESSPTDVIKYFANMRTNQALGSKTQGIETPSQVRYVNYFFGYLHYHKGNADIFKSPFGLQIHNLEVGPLYNTHYGPLSVEVFELPEDIERVKNNENSLLSPIVVREQWRTVELGQGVPDVKTGDDGPHVSIKIPDAKKAILFRGNIRMDIYYKISSERRKLMSFWLNTFLVKLRKKGKVLKLKKSELDKVHKDVEDKLLPPDFKVRLVFSQTNRASFHLSSRRYTPE